MKWAAFDEGVTIGTRGSEDGITIRDDEHADGARVTLESDTTHAPFAITCGIYGWMFHTRYLSSLAEAEAEYEQMRTGLAEILAMIPLTDDPQAAERGKAISRAISSFVEQYP